MAVSETYLSEFSEPVGYLDFAAIGPPSRRVRGAISDAYLRLSEPDGPVGPAILGAYEASLATAGRFLGVAPELVTAIPSTSTGLFRVAFGLAPFGGNVVLAAHEFPANVYPWLRAAGMGGPEVRMVEVPDRRVTAGALSEAVDDQTCWFAGSNGKYGFTNDGGESWNIDSLVHPEHGPLHFRSIAVTDDAVHMLSIGSPALLYRSTDMGENWELTYQENDSSAFYDAMAFWDNKNGIAMGDPTDECLSIIKTSDGGNSWSKISCDQIQTGPAQVQCSIEKNPHLTICLAAGHTSLAFFNILIERNKQRKIIRT